MKGDHAVSIFLPPPPVPVPGLLAEDHVEAWRYYVSVLQGRRDRVEELSLPGGGVLRLVVLHPLPPLPPR